MMSEDLLKTIRELPAPVDGFYLFQKDGAFWGKDSRSHIVFAIKAVSKDIVAMSQTTKYLKLFINTSFSVSVNSITSDENLSGLVLMSDEIKHEEVFVRLTQALANDADESKLLKHFLNLKDLFSNEKKATQWELQGVYGELLAMYVLKNCYGIDISAYYQRVDRTKFDFSISDRKKIEVKTTLKPERIHHFLQQQLDIDRCDIKVISIMLQKDDAGLSLFELANESKTLFAKDLMLMLHIEAMIGNIDETELKDIRFNLEYGKNNLRIFDANKMPRIKEKNAEGVFNVEYDVDLTNTDYMTPGNLLDWITKR